MAPKYVNMMTAVDLKDGYNKNGVCPWRLPNELKHFAKVTKFTKNSSKKNAIIMGVEVWNIIPNNKKPLIDRVNVIIKTEDDIPVFPDNVLVYDTLEKAIDDMENDDGIEVIWIIGGASIYREAMNHPSAHRVYMTEIQTDFGCDTFFPEFRSRFQLLKDHGSESELVPMEKQEENGLEYYYRIYEKK